MSDFLSKSVNFSSNFVGWSPKTKQIIAKFPSLEHHIRIDIMQPNVFFLDIKWLLTTFR